MRKMKAGYQCETCGSIFKTAEECEAHEKLHIKPLGICSYLGCYTLARVVENSEGGEKHGKG